MEFSITRSRVSIARLFGLAVMFLMVFTSHSFAQDGVVDLVLEISGLSLLGTATLGRLWALMYIAGNKKRVLITTGPFSIMRHPLYFFGLIGGVGIGLASENVLVLACIVLFCGLYYPPVILAEEKKLTTRFGQLYLDYMNRVPRVVPRLSLYSAPECWEVKMPQFMRSVWDALWFVWVFLLLHTVEALQQWGVVPILWKLP